MKRVKFFLLAIFTVLIISNIVVAQPDVSSIQGTAENISDQVDKGKEILEDEKWEYLGDQWKEVLLKNSFISRIDSFLTSVGFIFIPLIGQTYDFSFTFFVSFIYWILFFLILVRFFELFFESWRATLWALGGSIVLGVLRFYSFLAVLTFKIIFYKSGAWSWVWALIILVIWIISLAYVKKFVTGILKGIKERKKQNEIESKVEKGEEFREEIVKYAGESEE